MTRTCASCGRVLRPEAHGTCAPCIARACENLERAGGTCARDLQGRKIPRPAQGLYRGPVTRVPDTFDADSAARIAFESFPADLPTLETNR